MFDELVKRLRDLHPEEFGNKWDFAFACQQAMREAADAIESINKAYQMISEAYEAEVTKQNWIPVTETLPDYPGRFMCYYEIDDCGEVGHCIDWGRYDPDDGWYVSGVTHWQPLPEPPKED